MALPGDRCSNRIPGDHKRSADVPATHDVCSEKCRKPIATCSARASTKPSFPGRWSTSTRIGPMLLGKTSGAVSTGIGVVFFAQPAADWSKAVSMSARMMCFRLFAAVPGFTPSLQQGPTDHTLAMGIDTDPYWTQHAAVGMGVLILKIDRLAKLCFVRDNQPIGMAKIPIQPLLR